MGCSAKEEEEQYLEMSIKYETPHCATSSFVFVPDH
jgi:hypothetical protein